MDRGMQEIRRWVTFVSIGLALFFLGASLNDTLGRPPLIAGIASDFREFYCAGDAVLQHDDPYRVEPLRTCIHRVQPAADAGWLVTPAPLPGYTLALFSAFAKLPFPLARLLWEALLVACVLVASLALAKLTGWSSLLISLCLIPTVGLLNLAYGELTPVVVAALCVGALALERGFPRPAAVCAGVAMIEPHIGLPALGALVLLVPRARSWAFGVTAVLAAISILSSGPVLNVEYFRSVLPLHAFAEVVANDQYSLTRVLAMLGASPSTALLAGSASYVVMVAVGITLAAHLRGRRLAYVLLLPPAAAALGGSFIHDVQIAAALPAALLLAADLPALRGWAIGAAMLLIVHVGSHGFMTYVSLAALLAVAVLSWMLPSGKGPLSRALAVAASLLVTAAAAVLLWALPHPPDVPQRALPATTPNEYASTAWGAYIRSRPDMSRPSARTVVEKFPSWLGLLVLMGCALRARSLTSTGEFDRAASPESKVPASGEPETSSFDGNAIAVRSFAPRVPPNIPARVGRSRSR
jgi:hypothetical protein